MPHRFHLIDLLLFTSPVAFVVFVLVVVLMFVVLLVFVLVVAPVWLESWLRVALLARRWAARRLECGPVPAGAHRFIYLVVKQHGSLSGTVLADQRDPTSWALPVCRPCTYRGAGAPRYSVYGIRRSSFSPDPDALKDLGPGSRTTVHGMRWTELTWPHHT